MWDGRSCSKSVTDRSTSDQDAKLPRMVQGQTLPIHLTYFWMSSNSTSYSILQQFPPLHTKGLQSNLGEVTAFCQTGPTTDARVC